MLLTLKPARLTGLAVLAVAAATALSVGACSKSHDDKSSAGSSAASSPGSASPGAPGPAKAQDFVHGLIASVSGTSVQVTHESETATVDVGPSARIVEYSNAQLPDFAPGNCVRVNFTPAPNPGPGTAMAVQQNLAGPGDKCPQPKTVASGSPGALLPAGPVEAVIGTIASVAGNTITVANTDANGGPSQIELTVNDKTRYSKGVLGTPQAIAQGKCISASGTKNSGGALEAAVVTLTPSNNGKCGGK